MKEKITKKMPLIALATITAAVLFTAVIALGQKLNGAGASFPAPVYRPWTYLYKQEAKTDVNYLSVGSGAGIAKIKEGTVDFGASDKPLKKEELDAAGLIQFPMLMGGVVPIINIPGVKSNELVLSGPALADIFLGKIKKWNDPVIKKLNPKLKLPDSAITVVHRSDGSGTTWIYTNYLSKVSESWKNGPGCGKAVKWPKGNFVGGQKNPGVANNVKTSSGSIGYVEYTYATQQKLATVKLQNKAGKAVAPSIAAFSAAGASADWKNAPGYYMVLTDQPGDKSWPITGVTYILIYKKQKDAAKAKKMLDYFRWCYSKGAAVASKMDYVPIPKNVVDMVEELWKKELTVNGKPLIK